ncbi:HAD-IA family hydrolase [Chthonobacter albigriseus]|uniref:HAD-IA family hydrolase n=1 Tax=Chthonobacter albigriseus TaxID=1683161 RepID=UPI0015EF117E|nr:HAD-IA family hydrolase [Chthonobacter albigriseus]
MSWPKAIIFDLDGTLVDSLPDIWDALGEILEQYGEERHSIDVVRTLIGKGVENLVQRAFAGRGVDLTGPALTDRVAEYLSLYEPRATRDTRLFPYVSEVVAMLAGEGHLLGVCTNKPTDVSRAMVAEYGLAGPIRAVVGGDHGPPRKPNPDLLFATATLLGVGVDSAVMIGDSASDVDAAKAAGMPVVAVEYGYTSVPVRDLGADVVIRDFSELPSALSFLRGARGCVA